MSDDVIKFPRRGREYKQGFSAGYTLGQQEVQTRWDNERHVRSNGTIGYESGPKRFTCGHCGREVKNPLSYCPNCGIEWAWIEIYEPNWREKEKQLPRDLYYPRREKYDDWLYWEGKYEEVKEWKEWREKKKRKIT